MRGGGDNGTGITHVKVGNIFKKNGRVYKVTTVLVDTRVITAVCIRPKENRGDPPEVFVDYNEIVALVLSYN